jgi:phage/plasmid-like protein (TIGR03299 family)
MKVVREADMKPLGRVSSGYEIIQPRETVDVIAESMLGTDMQFETCGLFQGGTIGWWAIRNPGDIEIKRRSKEVEGDVISKYTLFYTHFDGRGNHWQILDGLRMLCANEFQYAMQKAENKWKLRHSRKWKQMLNQIRLGYAAASGYYDQLAKNYQWLEDTNFSTADMKQYTHTLFELDAPPEDVTTQEEWEKNNRRKLNQSAEVERLFREGKGCLGVSGWDAINAVTEFCDHHQTVRVGDKVSAEHRHLENAILDKNKMKQRALPTLMEQLN